MLEVALRHCEASQKPWQSFKYNVYEKVDDGVVAGGGGAVCSLSGFVGGDVLECGEFL